MATSITSAYLNQDKRETEALTITLPSVLNDGGGRLNADPTYLQSGEDYVASVIPNECIISQTYLVVDEAFPTGAKVTVSVAGTEMFKDVAVDALGLTISTETDKFMKAGGDVKITVTSGSGDVKVGKLMVISNCISYAVKNGRYSTVPAV